MKRKKQLLHVAILTFMVFSLLLIVPKSYAYWSDIQLTDVTTQTVNIGEWEQIYPWDPNETYQAGDRVSNNGMIYEAKRDNPTREPGVDGGWNRGWTEIGPA